MKKLIIYPLILAMVIAQARAEDRVKIELDADAVKNLSLEVSEAKSQSVQQSIRAAGTVHLNEKRVVEVTPRIPGMIVEAPRSLGDQVKKGDTLCTLKSAELAEKIAHYVASEEAMIFAASAAEQERKLAKEKLSSVEQLREKEMNLTQAVAAHAQALQPLKLLDFNEGTIHGFLANVEAADYTTLELKAPEAGEIIAKEIRRGAAVDGNESLFTIAELTELWVDFYVSLRDVGTLETGGEVRVESSVSDLEKFAKIIYISPVADDQSRAVLVRALLENKDGAWRPGTPVTVFSTSQAGDDASSIAVPLSALVDFDGGKAVFLKTGETTFEPVPVEVGPSDGAMAEIVSGLKLGQTVVTKNAAQLKGHLEMTAGE